ncbi:MAG: class I SAM-dependent methyltransferase [Planctomycetales bacterium]|nr:class I SAM-dependent methyltransferase [Planctomycetales bacterium]
MADSHFLASDEDGRDAARHNAAAWDRLAREAAPLARPATDAEFRDPLKQLDPLGWLGGDVRGQRILCLAAGGGRQSALYAAAGAQVTVVDVSGEMLALDRAVARERGLSVRAIQASMDALPMLAADEFDAVVHPVSTCYVPDVQRVFREVARVLRPGGVYVSQHKSPVSLQTTLAPGPHGYALVQPYYQRGPLPPVGPHGGRLREPGTREYLHRWEELIGGICRAGFIVEDFVEPVHAKQDAAVGSHGHRGQFVAPYVRIKARRRPRQAAP